MSNNGLADARSWDATSGADIVVSDEEHHIHHVLDTEHWSER